MKRNLLHAGFIAIILSAALWSSEGLAQSVSEPPLPETPGALPYHSVAEALEAARAEPGAVVKTDPGTGWTTVNVEPVHELWSFSPKGYVAYPAAVRRTLVVDAKGNISIEMNILCESDKTSCDTLVRDFLELNRKISEQVSHVR